MNHLQSDQERKDRWYARHLQPHLVDLYTARDWQDVRLLDEVNFPECYDYPTRGVASLPFAWLASLDERNGKRVVREHMQKSLDSHGFLVVSGVLNFEECQKALDLAWDWLEASSVAECSLIQKNLSNQRDVGGSEASAKDTVHESMQTHAPVNRHGPSSLQSPFFPKGVEGGIQPFYGSGHSTFAWTLRSHPNVLRVFESLYDTRHLLSSLDGIILWKPHDCCSDHPQTETRNEPDAGWFHVDQNPRYKPHRACVQGLINLLPVTSSTGGNTLVAQSHRKFPHHYLSHDNESSSQQQRTVADFYRQRLDEVGRDDWLEIDPCDVTLLDPSKVLSLKLAPGDVLLWDSRLVHCSYPGPSTSMVGPDGNSGNAAVATLAPLRSGGLVRVAGLVTLMPADCTTQPILQGRYEACREMRTLTHWIDKAVTLGGERPDEVALEAQRLDAMKRWAALQGKKVLLGWDDLSEEQRRLVVGESNVYTQER